jgi:hypothetical protein
LDPKSGKRKGATSSSSRPRKKSSQTHKKGIIINEYCTNSFQQLEDEWHLDSVGKVSAPYQKALFEKAQAEKELYVMKQTLQDVVQEMLEKGSEVMNRNPTAEPF